MRLSTTMSDLVAAPPLSCRFSMAYLSGIWGEQGGKHASHRNPCCCSDPRTGGARRSAGRSRPQCTRRDRSRGRQEKEEEGGAEEEDRGKSQGRARRRPERPRNQILKGVCSSMILSGLPSPAQASFHVESARQGFAQA